MAHTAHTDPEQLKERFDSQAELDAKVDKIVKIIKGAKHIIFFTGAGISTSAGIPDFRGPDGVWTLRAQGKVRTGKTTPTLKAIPTATHMAIKELLDQGVAKFLVSQNTDGLHRRSGVDPTKLAELHGNSNLERCETCGKDYLRDFHTRSAFGVFEHYTGRLCSCGGKLKDTIINFGENLPDKELTSGFHHAETADVCIALGSSLTVTPAANIPKKIAKRGGNLIICNLQHTPLDERASVRVYAKTDNLMAAIMAKLNINIPTFKLSRRIVVKQKRQTADPSKWRLIVQGVDPDGTPATIIQKLEVSSDKGKSLQFDSEPFRIKSENMKLVSKQEDVVTVSLKMYWFEHYAEPPLQLTVQVSSSQPTTQAYTLLYDPHSRTWEVAKETK